MPDRRVRQIAIEPIAGRAIVSLKVMRHDAEETRQRLALAAPLEAAGVDPQSLWVAPNHWLLLSDRQRPSQLIDHCTAELQGMLHNAVNQSAGLAAVRITGSFASRLVAAGSGIDVRSSRFPVNTCFRTRLAQVAAIVVATDQPGFDLYVDRSYAHFVHSWLVDEISSPDLRREIAGL